MKIPERINKTYIIPSRYGMALASLVLLMLFMAFVYMNNLVYAAVFFVTSLSIQNMVRTAKNVESLDLQLVQNSDLFAHENGSLAGQAKSKKLNYLYFLKIEGSLLTESSYYLEHTSSKKSKNLHLDIRPQNRGSYPIGKLKVESDFPFGFFRSWKTLFIETNILVFPERKGDSLFSKFKNVVDTENSDDFQYHEEYRDTSPKHRIDWKVYSRTQELYIRKYSSEKNINIDFQWDDVTHLPHLETKLSQLSLWIFEAYTHQMEFSLKLPHRYFPPSNSHAHYHECLKELALWKHA